MCTVFMYVYCMVERAHKFSGVQRAKRSRVPCWKVREEGSEGAQTLIGSIVSAARGSGSAVFCLVKDIFALRH